METVFGIAQFILDQVAEPSGWQEGNHKLLGRFFSKTVALPETPIEAGDFLKASVSAAVSGINCAGYISYHLNIIPGQLPQDLDKRTVVLEVELRTGSLLNTSEALKNALFSGASNPQPDKASLDPMRGHLVTLGEATAAQARLFTESLSYNPSSDEFRFEAPVSHGDCHPNPFDYPVFRHYVAKAMDNFSFTDYPPGPDKDPGVTPHTYGFPASRAEELASLLGMELNVQKLKNRTESPTTTAGGSAPGGLDVTRPHKEMRLP